MKQKPTKAPIKNEAAQRPEERQRHPRHGAHQRPALRHRAVLHQRQGQRLPRLQRAAHRAGATASSARWSKAWMSSTRSRGEDRQQQGFHQDVPVEDVVITKAEVVGGGARMKGVKEEVRSSDARAPRATPSRSARISPPAAGPRRPGPPAHLRPALWRERPAEMDAFPRAVSPASARRATSLYILGDLFEYWIGDDAARNRCTRRFLGASATALAPPAVPVYFMHGNRDFLLGAERFANHRRDAARRPDARRSLRHADAADARRHAVHRRRRSTRRSARRSAIRHGSRISWRSRSRCAKR